MSIVVDGSSWIGFNHQQMIEEVADQIRNPAIPTKITRWLNWTALRIWSTKVIFPFFERYPGRFDTRPDFADYNLADEDDPQLTQTSIAGPIKRLLRVWIGEVNTLLEHKSDGPRQLYPITTQLLTEEFPEWRTQKGRITHYIWYPWGTDPSALGTGLPYEGKIRLPMITLVKVPDTEITIHWIGYVGPNLLVGPLDISTYPSEWHPLIMQGAIVRGLKYERSPDVNDAIAEFNTMFRDLLRSLYVRPDQSHHFLTRNATYSGKPAYPMLDPEHFPRIF